MQTFLAVAETGSLSAAARDLNLTQPTVGRHVQSLETDLGLSLFKRQARGMALTPQGAALLDNARAMREAAKALSLNAAGGESDLSGTVRVTSSVFVAHHILPAAIAEMRETHPEIQLELVATDQSENLLYGEADIAVRMYRPTQLDIVAKHVGTVQLALFGAESYVQRRGQPTTGEELMTHDIIGYDRNEDMIRGFREAGMNVGPEFFPVRCDNNTVVWELVRAGAGLGFGIEYAGQSDPLLRQIDFGVEIPKMEVWLAAHERVRRAPRVDAVWSLLSRRLSEVCICD
ncbi:MAG: LysR family transcriptional regulator [Pseudomonadota bacterium]